MSGKQNKRKRTESRGGTSQSADVRAQKRAQFEQPRRRTTLHLVLAGVALVAVVVIAAVVVMNRGGGEPATATTASAQVATMPNGSRATLTCAVTGQYVHGTVRSTTQWDRLATNGYVSHAYIRTSTSIPGCGSTAAPSPANLQPANHPP